MSVRLRRLKSDYHRMSTLFTGQSRIRILDTLGSPPEKYQLEFLVTSVQSHPATKRTRLHRQFVAELTLTGAYPRLAPVCRMLTPVFHPNIAPHAVCVGDHWAAGESLPNLVVRIAEMLAFQSYNVQSPLDGEAARWVELNRAKLPLDPFDFSSLLMVGEASGREVHGAQRADAVCANCSKPSSTESLSVCDNQHLTCSDCALPCPRCERSLCLNCTVETCGVCGVETCARCVWNCGCSRRVCNVHTSECAVCGERQCQDCRDACLLSSERPHN